MSALIKADQLVKTFRSGDIETTAVNNVSFEIGSGEYVVLAGPSGCGKTTLLNMLGLMDKPSGGALSVDGVLVNTLNEKELSRIRGLTCSFIFQAFNLVPYLTVRQNITMPLKYHRNWSKQYRNERAEEACASVEMGHRMNHYPFQLSGGQQQRIAIARALAGNPRLLLVDEPTGNLDEKNGKQVMALLDQINQQGTAICLVTHDHRYQEAGQRTLTMHDGQLVGEHHRALSP